MKVFGSIEEVSAWALRNTAVTIGVFDGVHVGHCRIIGEIAELRRSGKANAALLVTFDPHPLAVTHSKMTPPILTTVEERMELVGRFGLDGVFVIRFTREIADMDYREFFDKFLLRGMKAGHIVVGYDFRFGKNREGDTERMEEEAARSGISAEVIEPVLVDGEVVSSTRIRNLIMEGKMEEAVKLLGHPYPIRGRVVKGHGRGASLGYPTANISVAASHKLWPANGVYAVEASVRGGLYGGMMNVGYAPTMKELGSGEKEMEVHLFDFEGDLYGEVIFVHVHSYIRSERRFGSASALRDQLESDAAEAARLLELRRRGALS